MSTAQPVPDPRDWRIPIAAFVAVTALLTAANRKALATWFGLWLDGDVYALAVVAAFAWSMWCLRREIRALTPAADWRSLLLVAPLAAALWVAYAVDIRVLQLAIFIASVGALIWLVFGVRALRLTAYPLGFLLLALPFWYLVEPLLQALTVRVTVLALRVLGFPVFVDNTYIQVPQGTVVVLAECSGAQFFQAGLTLGAMYAYLTLRTAWGRIAVIAAFAAASLIGNWARVLALVLLGPLNELAHLNVGWIVFALSVIPAYLLAAGIQKREPPRAENGAEARAPERHAVGPATATLALCAVAAALLLIGPATGPSGAPAASPGVRIEPVAVAAPWRGPFAPRDEWRPAFGDAATTGSAEYSRGDDTITVHWAHYGRGSRTADVIDPAKLLRDPVWQPREGDTTTFTELRRDGREPLAIAETRLEQRDGRGQRLLWHWYRVAGRPVVRPLEAKVAALLGVVGGGFAPAEGDARAIVLSARGFDATKARELLQEFAAANADAIGAAIAAPPGTD